MDANVVGHGPPRVDTEIATPLPTGVRSLVEVPLESSVRDPRPRADLDEAPRTPAHRTRRRATAAASFMAASIAAVTIFGSAHGRSPDVRLGACDLTPAAAIGTFAASLGTYRVRNGVAEVLHSVQCSDGRTGSVWIPATIIDA